jgi:hypothetical protein
MPETPSLSLSFFRAGLWPGDQEICRALRPLDRKIEACHLNALRRQPPPPDEVSLTLFIDDQGGVERVTASERYEHPAPITGSAFTACLTRSVRKLKFGRPTAFNVEIDVTFAFH